MRRPNIQYEQAKQRPCGASKHQIDEYASKAAASIGLKPGEDISPLVKALGGQIHFSNPFDEPDQADSIWVHGKGEFDIAVSMLTSAARTRFTIAHELGHYVLHSQMGKTPLIAARSGSDRAEWEANWFAAGLLMPREEFKRLAHERRSVSDLASAFGVSTSAVEIRAKSLGVADVLGIRDE